MNELVSLVRGKLRGKPSVGIRIPKFIGLMAGYTADILAKLGVKLPISSIRVKKFCASSEFLPQRIIWMALRPIYFAGRVGQDA